jgi:hypothetical protein
VAPTQRQHLAAEEGSMESGWAELLEELLTKCWKLLSSVHLRTEAGGAKASATEGWWHAGPQVLLL